MNTFSFHLSAEAGHKVMLDWLKKEPLLRLNMRLGEGTGAVLAFPIFDAAVKIFEEMATFQEAGISVGNEKGFDPETEAKVFNEFWKRRF